MVSYTALTKWSVIALLTASRLMSLKHRLVLQRPDNWCPKPALYLASLMLSMLGNFLVPFASNTPSFMSIMLITKASLFVPLLLPYITPASWGTVHAHPHDTHSAYTTLFKTLAMASLLLHVKTTIIAVVSNTPDSEYHRHSFFHPFKQEHRSAFERSTSAVGSVVGSFGDHPAVSAVAWDVLLSGISMGTWAAIRGLDVSSMLASSGVPFIKTTSLEVIGKAEEAVGALMKTE